MILWRVGYSLVCIYIFLSIDKLFAGVNGEPTAYDVKNYAIQNVAGTTPLLPLQGKDEDGTIIHFKIGTLPAVNTGFLLLNNIPVVINQLISITDAHKLKFNPENTFIGLAEFKYFAVDNQGNYSSVANFSIPLVNYSEDLVCTDGNLGPNILGAEGTFSAGYITPNNLAAACTQDGAEGSQNPPNNIGNARPELTGYVYAKDNNGLGPEGTYSFLRTLGTNSNWNHTLYGNCIKKDWRGKEHTGDGGYFMAINGSTDSLSKSGKVFFRKTVTVCPNTLYEFSAWLSKLVNGGTDPNLRFKINGTTVSVSGDLKWKGPGEWTKFGSLWYSGNETVVELTIENNNFGKGGNDLGLDDISMAICGPRITYPDLNLEPKFCSYGVLPLQANVKSSINTYTSYIFQRSINNGLSWEDIGSALNNSSPSIASPVYDGASKYSYQIVYGDIPIDPSMNGYRYRLKVATNPSNLIGENCNIYADEVITIKAFNIPDGGLDLVSCEAITSAKLTSAKAGETWSVSSSNPVTVSINQSGEVSGIVENGIYKFFLSNIIGCIDTVVISRSEIKSAGKDVIICDSENSYQLAPAPENYRWEVLADNPGVASVNAKTGFVSNMTSTGEYRFKLVSNLATCGDIVIIKKISCTKVGFKISESSFKESEGRVKVDLMLDHASEIPVSVRYKVNTASSATNLDYTLETVYEINFLPGEILKIIQINLLNDDVYEGEEYILFDLKDPVNASLSSIYQHKLNINDFAAPVALDDRETISPCQQLVKGTLANNDSDPDHALSDLQFAIKGTYDTSKGILNLAANGDFTFIPVPGFSGSLIINYRVTDPTGLSDDATLTINQPGSLMSVIASSKPVKCYGGNDGSISLSVQGGRAPYTYKWDNESLEKDQKLLEAGVYSVLITDANGCSINKSITVVQAEVLTGNLIIKNTVCRSSPDGFINAVIRGGEAPYTYRWNNQELLGTSKLDRIASGKYSVTVTDAKGCSIVLVGEVLPGNCSPSADDDGYETLVNTAFTLQTPGIMINDRDPDDDDIKVYLGAANNNGSIKNNAIIQPAVKTEKFRTLHGVVTLNENGSFSYMPDKDFTGKDYYSYRIDDGDLISTYATVSIDIKAPDNPPLSQEDNIVGPAENADIKPDPMFSPNGDGLGNDKFVIYNIANYPDNEVLVFNRWGNEVFRVKGYNNNDRIFQGVSNTGLLANTNVPLVDGVYYYIIYTKEDSGNTKMNKGYVILKR